MANDTFYINKSFTLHLFPSTSYNSAIFEHFYILVFVFGWKQESFADLREIDLLFVWFEDFGEFFIKVSDILEQVDILKFHFFLYEI